MSEAILTVQDHFDSDDNSYSLPDGELGFESPEDLILQGYLNFCGCGMPDEVIAYIGDKLDAIEEKWKSIRSKDKIKSQEIGVVTKRFASYFNSEGEQFFVLYVLDKEGLTEHGSSAGGSWLSKKGIQVHALIKEYLANS